MRTKMCVECGYVGKIQEILKDDNLANWEQLEKIFALKTKYRKGIDLEELEESNENN